MTIEIILTQGKIAIIDDEDYDLILPFKWCATKKGNHWYAVRGVKLDVNKWTTQHMHTLITEFKRVDHINGNGLDNTRINLRNVTNAINIRNQHINWGSSKFKGVYWSKRENKWCARIRGMNVNRHVGYFNDEIEAAKAYDNELFKIFNDVTMLNFPLEMER